MKCSESGSVRLSSQPPFMSGGGGTRNNDCSFFFQLIYHIHLMNFVQSVVQNSLNLGLLSLIWNLMQRRLAGRPSQLQAQLINHIHIINFVQSVVQNSLNLSFCPSSEISCRRGWLADRPSQIHAFVRPIFHFGNGSTFYLRTLKTNTATGQIIAYTLPVVGKYTVVVFFHGNTSQWYKEHFIKLGTVL